MRSCLLLLVPLGNTSFLGIPMVESFFGKNHIPYAILYDQLGSFLILATYGSLITSLYSKKPGEKTNILKKVFSFPPFLALLLSIPLSQLSYTPVFAKILQTLASTLIPLVMISVGLQLRFRLPRKYLFPLSISLFLKLVLMPMLTFFFCKLFYLRDASAKVAIFEAGMPPMITAGAVAILAGFAEDLAAALLAVGILLCFLTLPVVHWSLKFL
ncbi:MAG: AEC family transporter [Spirochaetota bacterium]